jgi:hypothetical protein
MNIEITAVDDSDFVGWVASATRIGEIYISSVSTLVTKVQQATKTNKILRLNIIDHGNPKSLQIGSDRIRVDNLAKYSPELKKLRPLFHKDAIVHLQHCDIGQNRVLLLELAKVFGRPVYAGTGAHNPLYRINFGDYVRADPDGTFHTDVGRPHVFDAEAWEEFGRAIQKGPGEPPGWAREI